MMTTRTHWSTCCTYTWHSEFEFAHFTNEEIAGALFAIHPGGFLTREDVVGRLDRFSSREEEHQPCVEWLEAEPK
jgi:hypothetical protein